MRLHVTAVLTMKESDLTRAVPVLTRRIQVTVNPVFSFRMFLVHHWRWAVGTLIAISAAIAAWIGVFA